MLEITMSELVYYTPSSKMRRGKVNVISIEATVSASSERVLILDSDIKEEKPVEVFNDAIEINEDLVKENNVYPLMYNGNQYYLRKNNGVVEIFQIEDNIEP